MTWTWKRESADPDWWSKFYGVKDRLGMVERCAKHCLDHAEVFGDPLLPSLFIPAGITTNELASAAWWMVIYGFMASERFTLLTPSAVSLNRERMEWYRIISMPREERMKLGPPAIDFSRRDMLSASQVGATQAEYECTLFWCYVLNESPRRFIKGEVSKIETSHLCEMPRATCMRPATKTAYTTPAPTKTSLIHVCEYHEGSCVRLEDTRIFYAGSEYVSVIRRDRSGIFRSAAYAVMPENARECAACGQNFIPDGLNTVLGFEPPNDVTYYCWTCTADRRTARVVRTDHNAPPPRKTLYAKGEPKIGELFGVELEIEFAKCPNPDDVLRKALDPRVMTAKHDGSLSMPGAEIVTSPASWRWWKENEKPWTDRLNLLRTSGFRSYDSGACGMHIHISRTAFTPSSLRRLLEFVYSQKELFIGISQRGKALKYCNFDRESLALALSSTPNMTQIRHVVGVDTFGLTPKEFIRKARAAFDENSPISLGSYSRYVAVHVPPTHPTVELRFFRGTLNVASFWKNIECAKSLVEFANSYALADMNDKAYVAFVVANEKRFPRLCAFLTTDRKAPKPTEEDNRPIHPEKLKRIITPADFSTANC